MLPKAVEKFLGCLPISVFHFVRRNPLDAVKHLHGLVRVKEIVEHVLEQHEKTEDEES